MQTIPKKNQIALTFIFVGLFFGVLFSVILPEGKLALALTSTNALIGAGLAEWSSHNSKTEDEQNSN
jgi:hypothetical protein